MKPLRYLYDGAPAPAPEPSTGDSAPTPPTDGPEPAPVPQSAGFDSLPEDLRGNASLAKFSRSEKLLEELARGYVHASSHIGRDPATLMTVPEDLSRPDSLRPVLTKLGLPGDPKGYKYTLPRGAEKFFGNEEGLQNGFLKVSHDLGILPHQVQGVLNWVGSEMQEIEKGSSAARNTANANNLAALKSELGQAYDQHMAFARNALASMDEQVQAGGTLVKAFNESPMAFNPAMLKALALMGRALFGEGSQDIPGAGGPGFGFGMTPAEARAKGNELLQQSMDAEMKNPTEARKLSGEAQKYFQLATGGI